MYHLLEKSCLYIIDTLYHQSVFCIILFILIFGLSRILKGKSPHWLLGLWFLILLRLILPTDFSLSFSARNLADDFLSAHNVNASLEEVSDRLSVKYKSDLAFDSTFSLQAAAQDRVGTRVSLDADKSVSLSWPVKLSIAWLIGVLTFLIVFVSKIQNIRRVLNHSELVRNKKTIAIVDYWRQSFNITRLVTLCSSNSFLSPFTTGLLRPKIFIPESFLKKMDNETINSIIAHEMVHIKNFDHAWVRFQNVLQILYFFNPVVWYANSQINMERDRLCDSEVLATHVIPPKAFGKSVIDVLKFNLSGYRVVEPQLCFSSHKNIYEYRIRDILKEKRISKTKSFSIFILVCLLGLFLLPMSSASIDTKKSEIPEEILSLSTEEFEAGTESDKILVGVPDDGVASILNMNISREGDTGQRVENEDISIQAVAEKDEQSEALLMPDSIKEKTNVSEKRTRQADKIEAGFSQASAERIKREEAPPRGASSEKKANFIGNGNQNNNNTIFDRNVKSNAPVKQRQNPSIDYFSRGMSYLKNGEVEDAVSDLSKAIKLNPENAVAFFARGNAYRKKGYDEKAISDYNEVISLRPGSAHAYNYRGSAYFVQEEYRKALADFSKAIALNPGFAAAYQNRGSVYYRMDKQYKAISDYNKSIALNPNLAASYQDRGSLYFSQDRFDKAISDYSKALQLNPEDSVTYNNRGIAYLAREEYQKAFDDFNKVIELNPGYADAYIYRGYYHQMMRAYSKAVADYNKALKIDPGIDAAKKLLKEAVRMSASVGSETIETERDQETVGLWVEKGIAKRKERRPERKRAELQKTNKWISKTTSSFPPHDGVVHTAKEIFDTFYAR